MEIFQQCNWPGNVRELENCIERAATMTRGNTIREADMRCQKGQCFSSVLLENMHSHTSFPVVGVPVRAMVSPPKSTRPAVAPVAGDVAEAGAGARAELPPADAGPPATERERLIDAMERCGWVQAKAARLLNMTPRQIGYALRKCNIEMKKL